MNPLDSWVWKEEPISPSSSIGYGDDKWLNFDDESVSSIINDNETSDSALYEENDSPSRAQVASKLLDELDEWIKEEPFSDWLEDKVLLFDELPAQECAQNKIQYPTAVKQQEPEQDQSTTQLLLQEFETVLGGVEACHQIYPVGHLTLTPPQSPPPAPEKINQQLPITTSVQLFPTFQPQTPPIQQQYHQEIPPKNEETTTLTKSYFNQISGVWNAENISLDPLADDVDSELAAVDEYVRSCAEDMSPSSPCTSTNGSYTSEDSTDDPEWTVNTSSASSSTSSNKINNSKQRNQRLSKTRSKPYSRPTIEDKKVRKKEQNKNAATRYRQKKKNEIKEIVGEEQELMDYNDKLNDQVKDLQREVGYLKGLMRDLFKAKGLIK